jgi:hypothetical protein
MFAGEIRQPRTSSHRSKTYKERRSVALAEWQMVIA